MLDVNFISVMLSASITGAGLILAVYGIISPLAGRLAQNRLEKFRKSWSSLEDSLEVIKKSEYKPEDFEKAKEKINEVEQIKALPSYFGRMILASFLGYIVTSVLCVWYFMERTFFSYTKDQYIQVIPWIFIASTMLFGYVGFKSIQEIIEIISKEFKNIKSEVEIQKEVIKPLTKKEETILKYMHQKTNGTTQLMSLETIFGKDNITEEDEKLIDVLILKGLVNITPYLTQKEKYSLSRQGLNVITILNKQQ